MPNVRPATTKPVVGFDSTNVLRTRAVSFESGARDVYSGEASVAVRVRGREEVGWLKGALVGIWEGEEETRTHGDVDFISILS